MKNVKSSRHGKRIRVLDVTKRVLGILGNFAEVTGHSLEPPEFTSGTSPGTKRLSVRHVNGQVLACTIFDGEHRQRFRVNTQDRRMTEETLVRMCRRKKITVVLHPT
jgi:hypothetical protein